MLRNPQLEEGEENEQKGDACFVLSTKDDAREVDEAIALLDARAEAEVEVKVDAEVEVEVKRKADVKVEVFEREACHEKEIILTL